MVAERGERGMRRRLGEGESEMHRTTSMSSLGSWTMTGDPAFGATYAGAAAAVPIPREPNDPPQGSVPPSWAPDPGGAGGGGGGGGGPPGPPGPPGGPPPPPQPGLPPGLGAQGPYGWHARVDPKLLERPVAFSGHVKDWRAWRIRFTAWLAGVDDQFDFCLRTAENKGSDAIATIDQNVRHLDRFLFIQMIGLVQGEYLDLILEAPFGFEAWKLCMEFEHLTVVGD